MYLLVIATLVALFLIFGLGYGSSLANRLGLTSFNNRFNLGARNVRSQNHQFFASNTSSSNSVIGDHERQIASQDGLRDEANYSENILDLSLDSFTKDGREKELISYGKFHQPMAAQSNFVGIRNESNREIILRALRSTMQQHAEGSSETKLNIPENSDVSEIFEIPHQTELARNR